MRRTRAASAAVPLPSADARSGPCAGSARTAGAGPEVLLP